MKTVETIIVRVCRICIGVSFVILINAVLVQIFGRIFDSSPIWTEELTRFALLYVASIGAGLSFRSGELVNVDIFCESFGNAWSARFRVLSATLTALLCVVLMLPAWRFVAIGTFQTSSALGVQMSYVHFSVFALLVILFLFALLRILGMLFSNEYSGPDSSKDL